MARYVDIIVRLNSRQFSEAMDKMGAESETAAQRLQRSQRATTAAIMKTGQAAQSVGRLMTGTGLALAGIGYVGVKAAVSFQTSMTRINTQAGATKAQVDAMSNAVLNLGSSGSVQYGPTELANALYHIESVAAGSYKSLRNTSTAMNALKIASEGAAVGGSDLEQTTTALMGALFATRAPLSQLPNMMGLLNATVGAGNMKMSDLVQALGRGLIPAFQQVGLKAPDAFAALALLADSGVKASSGAAQLSTALHFLEQPSAKADKYLAAINMTSTQMAVDLQGPRGLLTALTDLANHMKTLPGGLTGVDADQVATALFPGGRGRVMLTLLQNLDRYQGKISAIYNSTGTFTGAVKTQAQTMSGLLHTAWAEIQVDLTKFGTKLIPIITKYLPDFAHVLMGAFDWLSKLPPSVLSFATKLTGLLLIAGPLTFTLGKMLTTYARLRGALLAIRAAGVAAGVGEGAAATGMNLLSAAMKKFAPFLGAYLAITGASKVETAINKGQTGSAVKSGAMLGAGAGILGGATYGALAGSEVPIVGTAVGALVGALAGGGAGAIMSLFGGGAHRGARGGLVTHHGILHMAAGGGPIGSDNVPAWLSAGEGVVNRVGMAGLGAGGLSAINNGGMGNQLQIQPAPVLVYLDGRLIARSVLQQTLRKAARGPSTLVGGQLTTGATALG